MDNQTSNRTIHLEATVTAPVAEVWRACLRGPKLLPQAEARTTPQGIKSFFAPDCKALGYSDI